MSANYDKAAYPIAPNDTMSGTANDFQERKFTVDTTHSTNALPDAWFPEGGNGQFVRIVSDVAMHYAFSRESDAEVDRGVTATAAGASAKVGRYLPAGVVEYVFVTGKAPWYFVRESASAGTAYVSLSSK